IIVFSLISKIDHTAISNHISYILAPPSIPPLRGEEKDKLLILEGVGGRAFSFSKIAIARTF
ncbi:MAG: hypothetical protein ACKPKP_17550, partial [Dolichospermum sp.]